MKINCKKCPSEKPQSATLFMKPHQHRPETKVVADISLLGCYYFGTSAYMRIKLINEKCNYKAEFYEWNLHSGLAHHLPHLHNAEVYVMDAEIVICEPYNYLGKAKPESVKDMNPMSLFRRRGSSSLHGHSDIHVKIGVDGPYWATLNLTNGFAFIDGYEVVEPIIGEARLEYSTFFG